MREFQVINMRLFPHDPTLAYFDLLVEGLIIKGFRVIQGEKELFIGGPRENKDGKWYDLVFFIDMTTKRHLSELALKMFKDKKDEERNDSG